MILQRGDRECAEALPIVTQSRGHVGEQAMNVSLGIVPPAISSHHSHERSDHDRDAHGRRGGHIGGIILVGQLDAAG